MDRLLEQINDPADLRRLEAESAAAARARVARIHHSLGQPNGRPSVVESGHCGTGDRAALRLRYPARPPGVGRGAPDLRAQDSHRPPRRHGQAAPMGRYRRLPAPRRERVRHLRHRSLIDVDFGGARYGGCRPAQGREAFGRRGDRRRRDERRHGFRGAQQCGRRRGSKCW